MPAPGTNTEQSYQGRVRAVHGGPTAEPSAITYDVEAIGTLDAVYLRNVTPRGRVAVGVEIIAAAVGDLCWIKRMGDGSFRVWVYETIDFMDCQ